MANNTTITMARALLAVLALSFLAVGCASSPSQEVTVEEESPGAVSTTTPLDLVAPSTTSLSALRNLTIEIDGDPITLVDGRAERSFGGASTDIYDLRSEIAQGDLDEDGVDDVIAHVTLQTAGSGLFHYLVPILSTPDGLRPLPAVFIGDRVVLETVTTEAGMVTATTLDRRPSDPFTVVTEVVTHLITIDDDGATSAAEGSRQPLEQYLLPSDPLAAEQVSFEPGTTQTVVTGTIGYGQRQPYLVDVGLGQEFTADVRGPLGLIVHVRQGGVELHDPDNPDQHVAGEFPADGEWIVEVVSANINSADFELTIEVHDDPSPNAGPNVPPSATTAAPAAQPTDSPVVPTPGPTSTTAPASAGSPGTIYLTFDDGPNVQYTRQILEVLARYNARATFSVLGSEAQAHPELLDEIAAGGHTFANHTTNHNNLAGMTQAQFNQEVFPTQQILGSYVTDCLRPPYGSTDAFTARYAADIGLRLLLWTVDTRDWKTPGVDAITQSIVDGARNGAVILMHDGGGDRSQTVQALDRALAVLQPQGWTFSSAC